MSPFFTGSHAGTSHSLLVLLIMSIQRLTCGL
jgi:hypothetical protein